MTPTEVMLWQRLRRSQLGANFRRQQVIDGFIVDFYCHQAGLVVEADGPIHDLQYDAERDRVLIARGLTVLRFTNEQIRQNLDAVIHAIHKEVNRRLKNA